MLLYRQTGEHVATATLTEAQIETGRLWSQLVGAKNSLKTLRKRATYSSDWAKVDRYEKRIAAIEHRLTILKENA